MFEYGAKEHNGDVFRELIVVSFNQSVSSVDFELYF